MTISVKEYEYLLQQISDLTTLVHRLEAENSLLKNKGNSSTGSTAPSHDLSRSNRHSLRQRSGRTTGGQPGHRGHTLPMNDTPDEIIECLVEQCQVCGSELSSVIASSYTRRQEIDLPPVSPHYREYRSLCKVCPHCHYSNIGTYPQTIQAPIQYGPQVKSLVSYLSVFQHLPYKRTCLFLRDWFGLKLSQGSVDNLLEQMSRKAEPVYEELQKRICREAVVGADETGCHVAGKKHWFHVWQSKTITFIVSFASRSYQVIEKYFPDGFVHSFYVSDCYASQLKTPAHAHQLCIAHLLRELLNFEKSLSSQWSIKMKALLQQALELKRNMLAEDYLNPPQTVSLINSQLDELLAVDYAKFHIKEQALVKRLIKHRKSILTFLTHAHVPPDNNASERAIRNVKVKTKISGQFKNKEGKGAQRYAKIRSVIDTTIKNGQDVYTALCCLAKCQVMTS